MNFFHPRFELWLTINDDPQIALFRRFKGIQSRGIGFRYKARRTNTIV